MESFSLGSTKESVLLSRVVSENSAELVRQVCRFIFHRPLTVSHLERGSSHGPSSGLDTRNGEVGEVRVNG